MLYEKYLGIIMEYESKNDTSIVLAAADYRAGHFNHACCPWFDGTRGIANGGG